MAKVYKSNNKLVVYLPFDVIKALGIGEGDEIDFFRYNDKAFLFAKKSDIMNMIIGGSREPQEGIGAPQAQTPMQQGPGPGLSDNEIAVLKTLDTLRYKDRTTVNVERLLGPQEIKVLGKLIKEGVVSTFRSEKEKVFLYSISKGVYDRFLMRKRQGAAQSTAPQAGQAAPREGYEHLLHIRGNINDERIKLLERQGFVVLQTEAEAASVSAALEDSIKHGLVFGTRAFNRKFYIVLRSFLEKYSVLIAKELESGDKKVGDLAEKARISEDGVRAVLYYMSEHGDVCEKKRDLFRLA